MRRKGVVAGKVLPLRQNANEIFFREKNNLKFGNLFFFPRRKKGNFQSSNLAQIPITFFQSYFRLFFLTHLCAFGKHGPLSPPSPSFLFRTLTAPQKCVSDTSILTLKKRKKAPLLFPSKILTFISHILGRRRKISRMQLATEAGKVT